MPLSLYLYQMASRGQLTAKAISMESLWKNGPLLSYSTTSVSSFLISLCFQWIGPGHLYKQSIFLNCGHHLSKKGGLCTVSSLAEMESMMRIRGLCPFAQVFSYAE